MNGLASTQIENNSASRERWDAFSEHRNQIMAMLSEAQTGSLAVLGAGNCNDLDLAGLLGKFTTTHLVDCDAGALESALARQNIADDRLHLHGDIDITGVLQRVESWSPETEITPADLELLSETPCRSVAGLLPGPFTVTASLCVLSQLVAAVTRTLGEGHPRFVEVIQAIRAGHLRLLLDLTEPGGTGILISDFVSSETFPQLDLVPDSQLNAVLACQVQRGNFFHGLNPGAVVSFFRASPLVAPRIETLRTVGPWHWNFGPRTYAVYAVVFQKKAK